MRQILLLVTLVAGCTHPSADLERAEAADFGRAMEGYRATLSSAAIAEDQLLKDTLAWLDSGLERRSRATLRSEAGRFQERWAKVYFVPREIHTALRERRYRSEAVSAAQERVLRELRRRYFELHDFQRFSQRTAENTAGNPFPDLAEFRRRLQSHEPARALKE